MKRFISIAFSLFVVIVTMILYSEYYSENKATKLSTSTQQTNGFARINHESKVYDEIIAHIKDNALYTATTINQKKIVWNAVIAELIKKDPFAAYLSGDEYSKWKESQKDTYVGIGMEIEKDKAGQVICFPYPGSPAESAGVRTGDRLKSIDGAPVGGKSILAIGSLARGAEGTTVELKIVRHQGAEKRIKVKRGSITAETVTKSRLKNISILKIHIFTPDTPLKLAKLIAELDRTEALILDLRGNNGGDLNAAIDSAMPFLEKNRVIVSIKTRKGIQNYQSINPEINTSSPLIIWQDERTASAAEVFVAALTENEKAVSIGRKSYGKGTSQEIFELKDGSALIITTGYLLTPQGNLFNGIGLKPDVALEKSAPSTDDYIIKVTRLFDRTLFDRQFEKFNPKAKKSILTKWFSF